jgi:hypothetical protein
MGSGFLTDGTLEAQGAAAQGLHHHAALRRQPRHAAQQRLPQQVRGDLQGQPDVYAVQGYDAAQMLAAGLTRSRATSSKRDAMVGAMRKAQIDSPRGKFTLSAAAQPGAGLLPARGQGPEQRRDRLDLATFLVQCLNAVQYGLLLFLVASGLTLIFGIMGVINLAHGSFYMLGAYLAFVAGAAVRPELPADAAGGRCCCRRPSATCWNGPSTATCTSATTCSRC